MKKAMTKGLFAIGLLALLAQSAPSAKAQTVLLSDNFTFVEREPERLSRGYGRYLPYSRRLVWRVWLVS
jgi:hypothetical protein